MSDSSNNSTDLSNNLYDTNSVENIKSVTHITFNPCDVKVQSFKSKQKYVYKKSDRFICGSEIGPNFRPKGNGFVKSLINAYNHHHKLILRPDDIWIAIMTQFAIYINRYAKELRNKIVDFEGKEKITVYSNDTPENKSTQEHLMEVFSNKISDKIKDKELRNWVLPDFTTTTKNDRTVGSIILMAGMKSYFAYEECFMCGFPEITLLGSPEDWIKIRNKIDKLLEYDTQDYMHKWHAVLSPVIDQFVLAANGNANKSFWNKVFVYHDPPGSGTVIITGWFKVFCAFDENGWKYDSEFSTGDITSGIVQAPIHINDMGIEYDVVVSAGSNGFYVLNNNTLQPALNWELMNTTSDEKIVLSKWEQNIYDNTDDDKKIEFMNNARKNRNAEEFILDTGIGEFEEEDF